MLNRVLGFYSHAGWPACVYITATFALPLLGGSSLLNRLLFISTVVILFSVGYFFRYLVVRKSPTSLRFIRWVIPVLVVACLLIRFGGFDNRVFFTLLSLAALTTGLHFWAVSDDAYDMFTWINHPMEFAQRPSDFRLWHTTAVSCSSSGSTITKLWRFVCNGRPHIGITGPVTFPIDDGTFHTLTPEAVLERYRAWYDEERIGDALCEELDEQEKNA